MTRFLCLVLLSSFLLLGCANVKLVSSDLNSHKFCTNPGNKIAKDSDFDSAASKQCNGKYRFIGGGLEFFTDPKSEKIADVLEIQTQRRLCRNYKCQ